MRSRRDSMLTEVLPAEERAIEAVVARYQRVAPAITRLARSLADNDDLQVSLGSQASASEGEVVLDPAVFQAAYARSAPVTPTEVALASAFHEVVHLIATDLDDPRPIPTAWLEYKNRRAEPAPESRLSEPPLAGALQHPAFEDDLFGDEDADDLLVLGDVADDAPAPLDLGRPVMLLDALHEAGGPGAEALFLSLEDARQEVQYFESYPGARSVLADIYLAAAPSAFESAGPLGQYSLSCFLTVGGYVDRERLERRVEPHVAAAIDDASELLRDAIATEDAWDIGTIALQLLDIARLHGLIVEGSAESKKEQENRQTDEAQAMSDSVDAVRIVSPVLADADSYEQTRQAAHSVSAEEGRKGDVEQAGDPATDQIVRVSESPTVYLPTGQSGKLLVSQFPDRFRMFAADGHKALHETATKWGVAQRRVSGELYPLFLANQRRGLRSGYDAGDLSPYTPLLLGAGLYERMFERRDLPQRRSYGVSLLVDGSASMLQPRDLGVGRRAPWALAAATLGAWTLARLCDELQIEFEVAIFNRSFVASADDSEANFLDRRSRTTGALRRSQGGSADRLTRTVNHYLLKSFDDRWRVAEDVLAGLFWMATAPQQAATACRQNPDLAPPVSMFEKAANVDEFNVSYAADRLTARRVSTRVLVVLADGMTRGSIEALAESVAAVEHSGTLVLGIGIGSGTVEAAYPNHQIVNRPDTLARSMIDGVRSALYETIATMGGNTWWASTSERALQDLPVARSLNA